MKEQQFWGDTEYDPNTNSHPKATASTSLNNITPPSTQQSHTSGKEPPSDQARQIGQVARIALIGGLAWYLLR